jgi:hypothetical protein
MRAWLVLQEGPSAGPPGTGPAYPLDPFKKPMVSIGRSSECDIVLHDGRASRRHANIQWDGRQWTAVDLGSTNGTYVNGLRIERPHELRYEYRVTIGETTMVLRERPPAGMRGSQPPPPVGRRVREADETAGMKALRVPSPAARQPQPGGRGPVPQQRGARAAPSERRSTEATVFFWLVQGVIAAAVVCLGAGSFLPWAEVTGKLDLVLFEQAMPSAVIQGLDGYGRLTLAVAVIAAVTWAIDSFLPWRWRRTVWAGLVYILTGTMVFILLGSDLISYQRIAGTELFFGVRLLDVFEFVNQFMEFQINILIGSILAFVGLGLLIFGGLARLGISVMTREKR